MRSAQSVGAALCALGLGAVAEGLVAAWGALDVGGGWLGALAALWGAAGLMVAVGLGPAALWGAMAGTLSARRLGRGLRDGLGGGDPGGPGAALIAGTLCVAASVAAAALAGPALLFAVTEPFAVAGEAVVGGAALVALALPCALLGRALHGVAQRVPPLRHMTPSTAAAIALIALAAATCVGLLATLPAAWAVTPTAALAGLGFGVVPAVSRHATHALAGRRLAGALGLAALLAVGSVASVPALPAAARPALLYRAPYVGSLLGALHHAVDADGDGFSPLLLGGDCDDADSSVYPAARDLPGNGVDENCSGADARPWEPAPARHAQRPAWLPERPNVVILQIDALRPDHVGFDGYGRPTPELDAFRQGATWYSRAYTPAPTTRFAMASMFTGRDVRRVPHVDLPGNRFELSAGAETFAERLARAGYDTFGYTISYVMHHNMGLGQGFRHWNTPWPVDDWLRNYPVAATVTTDATLSYLTETPDDGARPFLLFSHYRCTHDPYIKYPEWDYGDSDHARYESALGYCDREIGRLLAGLAARRDWARTAVILLSDHGELFGEHGLTNHGNSLYETDVRVVLLARFPGHEGGTVETPVTLTDLAPTVVELAGLPPDRDADGVSLLAHLGNAPPPERPLFMFTELWRGAIHYQASAVVRWPHKLIRDLRTGTEELYDVAADPAERDNLQGSRDPTLGRLSEVLDSYEAWLAH